MIRFFKGMIVGLGGVAPGLSGSMLLIIFGLNQQTLAALGAVFKDLKKNICFLFPLVSGMVLGVLLFKRFYTATYSVIFGIFLVMIPNMLTEACVLGWNAASAISIAGMTLGFVLSYYLGDLKRNNERIRTRLSTFKNRG